eukprot:8759274-Pyramimonas_sp.AAC.1
MEGVNPGKSDLRRQGLPCPLPLRGRMAPRPNHMHLAPQRRRKAAKACRARGDLSMPGPQA